MRGSRCLSRRPKPDRARHRESARARRPNVVRPGRAWVPCGASSLRSRALDLTDAYPNPCGQRPVQHVTTDLREGTRASASARLARSGAVEEDGMSGCVLTVDESVKNFHRTREGRARLAPAPRNPDHTTTPWLCRHPDSTGLTPGYDWALLLMATGDSIYSVVGEA